MRFAKWLMSATIIISAVVSMTRSKTVLAETPTAPLQAGPFTFGGLLDSYSAHDYNNPDVLDRPYTTQALHADQGDINLAMLETKLSTDSLRGRLAVQYGTSVESNYAAENDIFWRYIQESSFGVKLSDKLWLDAGIYLSHIGFESFNSSDNWNYTRSLVAEYSPYYESGVKLTYQFDSDTTGQLHVLHGWQNISDPEDPAIGMQLQHQLTRSVQLTYANFLGDVDGQRIFNDFIGKVDLTDDVSVALQVDVGSQERDLQNDTVWWHGFSLMAHYVFTPTVAVGARVERFSDPHQVVLQTLNGPSFEATSLSANIDVTIVPHLTWRNEFRTYLGDNPVFPTNDGFTSNDTLVVTSLTYAYR